MNLIKLPGLVPSNSDIICDLMVSIMERHEFALENFGCSQTNIEKMSDEEKSIIKRYLYFILFRNLLRSTYIYVCNAIDGERALQFDTQPKFRFYSTVLAISYFRFPFLQDSILSSLQRSTETIDARHKLIIKDIQNKYVFNKAPLQTQLSIIPNNTRSLKPSRFSIVGKSILPNKKSNDVVSPLQPIRSLTDNNNNKSKIFSDLMDPVDECEMDEKEEKKVEIIYEEKKDDNQKCEKTKENEFHKKTKLSLNIDALQFQLSDHSHNSNAMSPTPKIIPTTPSHIPVDEVSKRLLVDYKLMDNSDLFEPNKPLTPSNKSVSRINNIFKTNFAQIQPEAVSKEHKMDINQKTSNNKKDISVALNEKREVKEVELEGILQQKNQMRASVYFLYYS